MDDGEARDDRSSRRDPSHGPARRPEGDPGFEMREPYLRQVLADFEAGRLEPYEYTRRVLAINAANSTDEMNAAATTPPVGPGGSDATPPPGLDAVDLARLRATRLAESRNPNARYITLAVVFVLFAVLIGIGMWLATHVHGSALSPLLHGHTIARPVPWRV